MSIGKITIAAVFVALILFPFYVWGQKLPLPESYGAYLVCEGRLVQLRDALKGGRTFLAGKVAGIKELSGISVPSSDIYFIHYETLGARNLALARLEQRGSSASGWTIVSEIPMNVGRMGGNSDMVRAVPRKVLQDGVYLFYVWVYARRAGVGSFADFISLYQITGEQETWTYDFVIGRQPSKGQVPQHPTKKPTTHSSPTAPPGQPTQIVYVIWPTVSLREGPGTDFKTLSQIKKGTALSVLEEKGQWFRVRLEDGKEGWVGKATTSETP